MGNSDELNSKYAKAKYFLVRDSLFTYDNSYWQDDLGYIEDEIEIFGKVIKENENYLWVAGMCAKNKVYKNIIRIYKKNIIIFE